MDRPLPPTNLPPTNLQQRRSRVLLAIASQFIHQRPWICWGGLCASAVAVSGMALFGLYSPFFTRPALTDSDKSEAVLSSQDASQPIGEAENPNVLAVGVADPDALAVLPPGEDSLSLWIFAAIALGVSTSGLVVWQRLQPHVKLALARYDAQRPKRQLTRRPKRVMANRRVPVAKRQSTVRKKPALSYRQPSQISKTAQRRPVSANVPAAAKARPLAAAALAPLRQVRPPVTTPTAPLAPLAKVAAPVTASAALATPPESTVTVVPAAESHPLDWRGNGLADALDLRKQHSLGTILRGRSALDWSGDSALGNSRLSTPLSPEA